MKAHALAALTATLTLSLASGASAQLSSVVGPPVAPEGCSVSITISNDTNGVVATGICPYRVFDDQGTLIYTPFCVLIAIQIGPGGTFSTTWDQVDDASQPVPPGAYTIEVMLPDGGTEPHDVEVADVDGGIAILGAPIVGTTRDLRFCAPNGGDASYLGMASLSNNVGLPTCGGVIPLDAGDVFGISLAPDNGVFQNFIGTLDSMGVSEDPTLNLPDLPALAGIDLVLAFLTFDTLQPCPITAISEPLTLTLQ